VHGFFVVGNPDETLEDMRVTFDFMSKPQLDTFSFNRLCVYRDTPRGRSTSNAAGSSRSAASPASVRAR
jgi:hypothetical protein